MKADASPTKDFFVRMITRDITLQDCLLDLVDNCVDGARRSMTQKAEAGVAVGTYEGYKASLHIAADEFFIEDNCGGISISNAIDYAFHFGRRPDAPPESDYSIGLYGIGMKRAILKIGRAIEIHSSTEAEAFRCKIDVESWVKNEDWTFDMEDAERIEGTGTLIRIRDIYPGIAEEFADNTFVNSLTRVIARDYARFLENGFSIAINGAAVEGHRYAVRESEEFQPYRKAYDDETGVRVEVFAGMAAAPPDSLEPTERSETGYFGWFVVCNDRVVLAADKTNRTVWGDEGFQKWHPQYNGFMGIVLFSSTDPNLLPWTTTKRDVDESSPLYRRAVTEMKTATTPWVEYTNQRKSDLEEARKKEDQAVAVPLFQIRANPVFKVPTPPDRPRVRTVSIQYDKPVTIVTKAAETLGNANMSARKVGEKTFDYYVKNEVED